MTQCLVLMKALPPTVGHEALINFAADIGHTKVLIDTHPDEPFIYERVDALQEIARRLGEGVSIKHIMFNDKETDQFKFWEEWRKVLRPLGQFDYVVGSEEYCKRVARLVGARFMPFDMDRVMDDTKATTIRNSPVLHFNRISTAFQPYLRGRITTFGAESTGKTTLAADLAHNFLSKWYFEYARPYLETTGNDVDTDSMTDIWKGQAALQYKAWFDPNKTLAFQDTDLFSTLGYWKLWESKLGPVPNRLIDDAIMLQSDLYLITPSNIPFEPDPLRYGGDVRETPDEFWIDLCEQYGLNYYVIKSNDRKQRIEEVSYKIGHVRDMKMDSIRYERL